VTGRRALVVLALASATVTGVTSEPAPRPAYTCTEDMSCHAGSSADARTNPGIGAERWQHVDWEAGR
jgi:hypothetical protein